MEKGRTKREKGKKKGKKRGKKIKGRLDCLTFDLKLLKLDPTIINANLYFCREDARALLLVGPGAVEQAGRAPLPAPQGLTRPQDQRQHRGDTRR